MQVVETKVKLHAFGKNRKYYYPNLFPSFLFFEKKMKWNISTIGGKWHLGGHNKIRSHLVRQILHKAFREALKQERRPAVIKIEPTTRDFCDRKWVAEYGNFISRFMK